MLEVHFFDITKGDRSVLNFPHHNSLFFTTCLSLKTFKLSDLPA